MIQSIKNWKVEFKKKIKRKNIQIDRYKRKKKWGSFFITHMKGEGVGTCTIILVSFC